jgi:alpha-beta hydrolase superfamily lysophospholipase
MTQYAKLDYPEIVDCLFHPRLDPPERNTPSIEQLRVAVDPGAEIVCRLHLADDLEVPTILFFHGNGETAADYDDIGPDYVELGINFFVADYRGYGLSSGVPNVSSMMRDCHVIFQQVQNYLQSRERKSPLLVMGRSLGSACAIELVHKHPDDIVGLIVESGFAQTLPLLLKLGVDCASLGITEQDTFQNVPKIMQITRPTLFLHAQYDRITPLGSAEILQAQSAARNKEFQVVPGADHNSILAMGGAAYFLTIRRFIDKILKIRPKRYRRTR